MEHTVTGGRGSPASHRARASEVRRAVLVGGAQHDRGPGGDAGRGPDLLEQVLQGGRGGDPDLEYVVLVPRDAVAGLDGAEVGQPLGRVVSRGGVERLDGDERGERQAGVRRVDHRRVAADQPAALQPAHPLVGRGDRQPGLAGQVGEAHPAVVRQQQENLPVDLFHAVTVAAVPPSAHRLGLGRCRGGQRVATEIGPGRLRSRHRCGREPGGQDGERMAEIVLDRVSKVYPGGVKGVDDLSLEISDGEFMVLVGPSGCGKSTALRSIAGLEEITSGTISIGGRVVNNLPPKDRDIAMVFQNYALYPHMTVEQNLAFGLQQRKTPKAEITRRVNEVARMLGIGEYLKRKPAALSGGQRQRVAMGRAIVREPRAFLMDEPLSNLDAKLRVSMRASLSQLHDRLAVTTVYVTHDQVEAMTLGHRVCVLRDGQLQQVDTPQALYDHPVNLFVAGFMGSPAMNFAGARLVRDNGPAVVFAGYRIPVPEALLTARPSLGDYLDRELIVGIRPSDFEDGQLADAAWPRMATRA